MPDNTDQETQKNHISPKLLSVIVIAVLVVAYLAAAKPASWWPFGGQEQESPSTSLGTTGDTASWQEDKTFAGRSTRSLAGFLPSDSQDAEDAMVVITILENRNNQSLQDFFGNRYEACKSIELPCPASEDISKWENINLAGVNALRSGKRGTEGPDIDSVYIARNSNFIIIEAQYLDLAGINFSEGDQNIYNLAPVFDQILSTFKFIN